MDYFDYFFTIPLSVMTVLLLIELTRTPRGKSRGMLISIAMGNLLMVSYFTPTYYPPKEPSVIWKILLFSASLLLILTIARLFLKPQSSQPADAANDRPAASAQELWRARKGDHS